jgi:hypothetical protein
MTHGSRRSLEHSAVLAAILSSLVAACSESATEEDASTSGGAGGSGGTAASGGTVGSGGGATPGGTTGLGGGAASGGTTGSGGAASGGTSVAGGGPATGGTTTSGGLPGTGGSGTTGGGTSVGGATGGVVGSGGTTAPGGATGVGGTTAAGGNTGRGGGTGNGGSTGRGGASQVGGSSAGGTTSGGTTSTGGSTGAGGSTGGGGSDACPSLPTAPASNVITFASSGGWCWYQDERAVVDTKGGKLVIGSVVGSGNGVGNIQATVYDLAGKTGTTSKLGNLSVDDHDAPALMVRPDGKYVAVWATHRSDCNTYYSIYDGSAWASQKTFDWKTQGCPWNGDNTHMITYSNLWYMDGKLFDVVRSVDTSPNLLSSSDDGATWSYFGRLTYTPLTGYVAGYYKYWGNNSDRIDFLGTEAHPRDNNNNLWHGYMQGGKIYNSTGTVVDDALAGTRDTTSAKNIDAYTKVFATGSTVGSVKLDHAWNYDIVRYEDGTVAFLGQGRVAGSSTSDPDKRAIYGRFDGTQWKLTYLAKMGSKLYSSEEDYTGLGALDPDNPHIIYLSTPFDPRDDTTQSSKHEIWQGVTCDNGATWDWAPITQGSSQENLRPIVPKWDGQHTALLWMRGTYTSAQNFATAVVGTISGP